MSAENHSRPLAGLRTPRAAAVAGVLFSIFFMTALVLARSSVLIGPLDRGEWLQDDMTKITLLQGHLPEYSRSKNLLQDKGLEL